MKVEMRKLSLNGDYRVFEMIHEIGLGENGFTSNFANMNYEEFLNSLPRLAEISKGYNIQEGYVPQTIYWLYIDDRPVAYGKLRHCLNDKLLKYGGHIGYIVRPSERGKGYGKLFLSELLRASKDLGIDRVLLTCDDTNIRSRRVIEANNGVLEDLEHGVCRY